MKSFSFPYIFYFGGDSSWRGSSTYKSALHDQFHLCTYIRLWVDQVSGALMIRAQRLITTREDCGTSGRVGRINDNMIGLAGVMHAYVQLCR